MLRIFRKGQSTAEYAIVIGLVIAAAVAMQIYVKRSLQAKVKDAVDYNDPAATMLTTSQYEPDYLSSSMASTRKESTTATTAAGGGVTRAINEDEANRTGSQSVTAAP
jgi:uncharacterized protein (UPF0333 family)